MQMMRKLKSLVALCSGVSNTNSLSKTVFSVKPLFKRFQRFEKSLYDLKEKRIGINTQGKHGGLPLQTTSFSAETPPPCLFLYPK